MPRSLPWLQWNASAWLGDEQLSLCSPATRGIWADAICVMHKRGGRGELRDTLEALAQVCRCTPRAMADALRELRKRKAANVKHNKDDTWTLVNRRMKRDEKRRKDAADRQRKRRKNAAAPSNSGPQTPPHRLQNSPPRHAPLPTEGASPELFADGGDPASQPQDSTSRHAPVTPERLRVKELTPLPPKARYTTRDIPELFFFAKDQAGFSGKLEPLARIAAEHGIENLLHAIEARAEFGDRAFNGLVNHTAALAADARDAKQPQEPGAFERWRRRRAEAAERKERIALARAFVGRTKAQRAELLQAAGISDDRLAEFSTRDLDFEIRTDADRDMTDRAAQAEQHARTAQEVA